MVHSSQLYLTQFKPNLTSGPIPRSLGTSISGRLRGINSLPLQHLRRSSLSSWCNTSPPLTLMSLRSIRRQTGFCFQPCYILLLEALQPSRSRDIQANQDGRLAWLALGSYAEGQGSKDTIARAAAHDIQYLRLTKDSVGGAEAYISKFDEALLNLEETGYPYHEGSEED